MKFLLFIGITTSICIGLSRCDDCLFTGCDCSQLASKAEILCTATNDTQQFTLNPNYPKYPTIILNKLTIQNYATNPLSTSKIFNRLQIDELILNNNNMSIVNEAAFYLSFVSKFTINQCKLINIPPNFFTPIANTLTRLAIQDSTFLNETTGLNGFGQAFQPLEIVDELILSGNKVASLTSNILGLFTNLRKLDLSNNPSLGTFIVSSMTTSSSTNNNLFANNNLLTKVKLDACGIDNLDAVIKSLAPSKVLYSL